MKTELIAIMNQINMGKVPVLNTQQDYHEATRVRDLLNEAMRQNRCIECLHRKGMHCQEYMQPIPAEYMCTVTECDKYEPDIPW